MEKGQTVTPAGPQVSRGSLEMLKPTLIWLPHDYVHQVVSITEGSAWELSDCPERSLVPLRSGLAD